MYCYFVALALLLEDHQDEQCIQQVYVEEQDVRLLVNHVCDHTGLTKARILALQVGSQPLFPRYMFEIVYSTASGICERVAVLCGTKNYDAKTPTSVYSTPIKCSLRPCSITLC
jgi:hypothetical protein